MLSEKISEDIKALECKNKELNDTIKSIDGKVYCHETKAGINAIAEKLMAEYPDYRRYALRTSRKKDLIDNIVMVCKRTIDSNNESIKNLKADLDKAEDKENLMKDREKWAALAEKVYPYKDEYIRDSESISEGVRQWDCLIELVETGYVTEDQLIDYGIDLTQPPQIN